MTDPGRASAPARSTCPNIVGMTAGRRRQGAARRRSSRSARRSRSRPTRPRRRSPARSPRPSEVGQAGHAGQHLLRRPDRRPRPAQDATKASKGGGAPAAVAAAAAAAAAAARRTSSCPRSASAKLDAFAKAIAGKGMVPGRGHAVQRRAEGHAVRHRSRPAGTKVAKGAKVKLLVSAGQPQVVFSNGKNILRINGANGKQLPTRSPTARTRRPTRPTTPTATHIAYVAGRPDHAQGPDEEERGRGAAHARRRQRSRPGLGADGRRRTCSPCQRQVADGATARTRTCASPQITKDPLDAAVLPRAGLHASSRVVHWAPDGKSILALGVQARTGGVRHRALELKQGKPFSRRRATTGARAAS